MNFFHARNTLTRIAESAPPWLCGKEKNKDWVKKWKALEEPKPRGRPRKTWMDASGL